MKGRKRPFSQRLQAKSKVKAGRSILCREDKGEENKVLSLTANQHQGAWKGEIGARTELGPKLEESPGEEEGEKDAAG